jgi:hypothetical protein
MLSVVILSVVMLSVVMLNVIILSVVSPLILDRDVFPEWGSRKNYLQKLIDVFGIFIKGEVIIKVSIMVITSTIWKKKLLILHCFAINHNSYCLLINQNQS